ncbi:hypothetical protein SELMODRAFT_149095 [Selaginella moellendorffii]|uniref:Uncharacterized protein n=1 Tax=Selaginella moellendorffii TaxID=88036 RepID=D8RR27_SELML|nr:uncharacterized protein LOC9642576 [Selaginella moellendorffii]EFJ25325.1 hypothetical protein SELMODRAFT_149095 [Selaginella moellendorffii]|eukprot:XP_002973665.1 uncharacterized protein LOC9642576 [Selaginella moellendorffii]
MDPAASLAAPPAVLLPDDDEWDAEGFEIPSLNTTTTARKEKAVETLKPTLQKPINTQVENLYLGPHGAKPGLRQPSSLQENFAGGKKQRFKQKLRDADHRSNGTFGRENKVEVICDLVGAKSSQVRPVTTPTPRKSSEWLDPHCQESFFEKSKTRG